MSRPQITVVIPTKDRPDMLRMAVSCVLQQAGVPHLRVLVIDDGSAVPVQQVLPPDSRVRVLRHDLPLGVCAARNRALVEVTTPWVALLDDDDLWAPHKLRRQLDAVQGTGYRWVCSAAMSFIDSQLLDVVEPPPLADVSKALLHGNIISGSASSVLADVDLVRAVGGFDESLPSLQAWDLWIRLAQHSPLARVPNVDVGYRVHPTSRGHDLVDQPRALQMMKLKYASWAPPLQIVPDASFFEYWARMDYDAGRWSAGLKRTFRLLAQHQHWRAVRTPVGAAMPAAAQRRLRKRRLHSRAARRPEQDWSWLTAHLRQP